MIGEQAVVGVLFPDGREREFQLVPTCDGFAVVDSKGKIGTLNKLTSRNEETLLRAKQQLVGEWSSITLKRKKNRARTMIWSFNEDGKFALAISPDFTHTILAGIWDLTPDGEHVLLFFTAYDKPETVYAREVLDIRGLDYEDLVIQGDTFVKFLDYKPKDTTLYFQKRAGI